MKTAVNDNLIGFLRRITQGLLLVAAVLTIPGCDVTTVFFIEGYSLGADMAAGCPAGEDGIQRRDVG